MNGEKSMGQGIYLGAQTLLVNDNMIWFTKLEEVAVSSCNIGEA